MIGVIAANTFREVSRDRLWLVLLAFGAALLIFSRVLTPIALGEGPRITVDLGLGALCGFGLLVVVVMGGSLVHQEIDRRTVHLILARPVSRATYLVGKWAGLTASLWLSGAVMGTILIVVGAMVRGPEVVGPLLQAVLLAELSFAVLTALAVLFSSLSTPILSSLYTLGLYALGWWTSDLRSLAKTVGGVLGELLHVLSYLPPHLAIFDARLAVAHAQPVPTVQIGIAAAYAACYAAAVLALAVVAFDRREFK